MLKTLFLALFLSITVTGRKLQEVGAPVYQEFDSGWAQGRITAFDGGVYTISWDDGSVDVDQWEDSAIVQMINNYGSSFGYEAGTNVYQVFDGDWYLGTITNYENNVYSITWSNGDVDNDDWDPEDVFKMVKNYQDNFPGGSQPGQPSVDETPPQQNPLIPQNTPVFKVFDGEPYTGLVTDFSPDEGYTITWSDNSVDIGEWSVDDINQMIADYQAQASAGDEPPSRDDIDYYEAGTPVYGVFDGVGYDGTITEYNMNTGQYTIVWADGSEDIGGWSNDDIAQMVANARASRTPAQKSENLSKPLIWFIVVVVLSISSFGLAWVVRTRKLRREMMENPGNINLERYSDQRPPDII